MKRLLTALVLLPVIIYIIGFTPPFCFTLVAALVSLLGLEEFFSLARKSGLEVYRFGGHLFSFLLIASFYWYSQNQAGPLLLVSIAALLFLVLGLGKGQMLQEVLPSASTTLFGLVYIPVLLGFLVMVRMTSSALGDGDHWILFFLLAVWFGDTGAYYVGRTLGKHRLAPTLSPKKTIEGALGGLLGNGLAAVLGRKFFLPGVSITHLLVLSCALGVVSQIGDLAESALKRSAGVKDSSNLLPGHGGILDRIDGILFGAPFLYCYLQFFQI